MISLWLLQIPSYCLLINANTINRLLHHALGRLSCSSLECVFVFCFESQLSSPTLTPLFVNPNATLWVDDVSILHFINFDYVVISVVRHCTLLFVDLSFCLLAFSVFGSIPCPIRNSNRNRIESANKRKRKRAKGTQNTHTTTRDNNRGTQRNNNKVRTYSPTQLSTTEWVSWRPSEWVLDPVRARSRHGSTVQGCSALMSLTHIRPVFQSATTNKETSTKRLEDGGAYFSTIAMVRYGAIRFGWFDVVSRCFVLIMPTFRNWDAETHTTENYHRERERTMRKRRERKKR